MMKVDHDPAQLVEFLLFAPPIHGEADQLPLVLDRLDDPAVLIDGLDDGQGVRRHKILTQRRHAFRFIRLSAALDRDGFVCRQEDNVFPVVPGDIH